MYIASGSGTFTGCTLSDNSAVSVVSCSWRCVFPSCDWRETGQSRDADPVCFVFAPWCCLFSLVNCSRVCFHRLQCLWAVLCVTLVWYWNLLFLVCFCGWCQQVSVVSCSWRCVCASCDWRETMKKVEWLTLSVLCLHLGVACFPGWFVSVSVFDLL